jgi:hypothetical protein
LVPLELQLQQVLEIQVHLAQRVILLAALVTL